MVIYSFFIAYSVYFDQNHPVKSISKESWLRFGNLVNLFYIENYAWAKYLYVKQSCQRIQHLSKLKAVLQKIMPLNTFKGSTTASLYRSTFASPWESTQSPLYCGSRTWSRLTGEWSSSSTPSGSASTRQTTPCKERSTTSYDRRQIVMGHRIFAVWTHIVLWSSMRLWTLFH